MAAEEHGSSNRIVGLHPEVQPDPGVSGLDPKHRHNQPPSEGLGWPRLAENRDLPPKNIL